MRELVVVDGAIEEPARARVSVFDRGFLYGDAAFEVLRTYRGRVPFASEHARRLHHACSTLGFAGVPDAAALAAEIARAVTEAALGEGEEAHVRVIVTRGQGAGLDTHESMRSARIVIVAPLTLDEASFSRGLHAELFPHAPAAVPGIKSGNYLANVMARREARARGASEAIFEAPGGGLVEAAGANVFGRFGGTLRSAPLEAGVLPGITRAHVAKIAAAEGLAVVWEAPALADKPDELFLTSSVRGVVPVRQLTRGGVVLFEGGAFPWAKRLREVFLRYAETLKSVP